MKKRPPGSIHIQTTVSQTRIALQDVGTSHYPSGPIKQNVSRKYVLLKLSLYSFSVCCSVFKCVHCNIQLLLRLPRSRRLHYGLTAVVLCHDS